MLLLRALGGSRLYGLAGPNSDWDWYEVHDHIRPNQKIKDGQDVIKMPLSKWLLLCEKGTHQALDALWCPPALCEVDTLQAFRTTLCIDPWRVSDQLYRTAYKMQTEGSKHHARLLHCSSKVLEQGWYDPTEWGRLNGL